MRSPRGNVIIGAMLVAMVIPIFVAIASFLHKSRVQLALSDWNYLVAIEAGRTSFAVMEAALRRRLWEAPPDSSCMKRLSFSVSGTTPQKATYEVTGTLDAGTNIISLVSKTSYKKKNVTFQKSLRVMEGGDFLALSKNKGVSVIAQNGKMSGKFPAGMIAKEKRIYFDGPVTFQTHAARPQPTACGQSTKTLFPQELSILLQAERMYILGGISYRLLGAAANSYPLLDDLTKNRLLPCIKPWMDANMSYISQYSKMGGAYITGDRALAELLFNEVVTPGSQAKCPAGPPCFPDDATLKKNIYPRMLFCPTSGVAPWGAEAGVDSGCYMGDPDTWITTVVWRGVTPAGPIVGAAATNNITCMMDPAVPAATRKDCSSEKSFPRGYSKWVEDAGLKNILITKDAETISIPALDWDNMEALEEDARACGVILEKDGSKSDGSYEDCDLSDKNMLNRYMATPNSNPCGKVYQFDIDKIKDKLSNFDPASYEVASSDPKRGLFLRRIIYSKVPLELKQNGAGLAPTLFATPEARQNISFWIVNEDQTILKPYQPDLTSPFVQDFDKVRQLYFNEDPKNLLTPLNLVMLSPEQLVVITSQYNTPKNPRIEYADLLADYPVVNGKIKPKFNLFTDYKHQNEDGYFYGQRDLNISNVLLVSNASIFAYQNGLWLRGMWACNFNNRGEMHSNACMFDKPGDTQARWDDDACLTTDLACDRKGRPQPTIAYGDPDVPAPAPDDGVNRGQNFYGIPRETKIHGNHCPAIFYWQTSHGVEDGHNILFKGLRILVDFDSKVPAGKRSLSKSIYSRSNGFGTVDLSERRIIGRTSTPAAPSSASCKAFDGVEGFNASVPLLLTNYDVHAFAHTTPNNTFTKLGNLFAVELPLVQVSQ